MIDTIKLANYVLNQAKNEIVNIFDLEYRVNKVDLERAYDEFLFHEEYEKCSICMEFINSGKFNNQELSWFYTVDRIQEEKIHLEQLLEMEMYDNSNAETTFVLGIKGILSEIDEVECDIIKSIDCVHN